MNGSLRFRPEEDISIDSSVIDKSKDINIKDVFHALTELITNSDDAYVELHVEGRSAPGVINIGIIRNFLGKSILIVSDHAGGMNEEKLVAALRFSGETSAYHKKRKSTRGLFGQGLKEASIALGTGLVLTAHGGTLHGAKILPTKKIAYIEPINTHARTQSGALKSSTHEVVCRVLHEFIVELLGNQRLNSPKLVDFIENSSLRHSGTSVLISIENDRFRVPKFATLKQHLLRKPQLRYVLADSNREVRLLMLDPSAQKGLLEVTLSINLPSNLTKVFDGPIDVRDMQEPISLSLYESPSRLPEWDAGLFFTCFDRVILDHQVWLEDLGDATFCFTGTVDVSTYLIPELDRKSYRLLPLTRQGLDWGARENRRVKEAVMEILRLHVDRKQKELERHPGRVSREVKESLRSVLKEVNAILQELESELDPKEPTVTDMDRHDIFIKPEYPSVRPGVPRTLSVYVPTSLGPKHADQVHVSCSNSLFTIMDECTLKEHSKYPEHFFSGTFRVFCHQEYEEGIVLARFNEHTATARCTVKEPTRRPRSEKLSPSPRKKRGAFTAIEPDGRESPYQRFHFDKESGLLKIFTKFPRTGEFIGSDFDKALGPKATREGTLLLSELVCDAIARVHVFERIESTQKREEGIAVENTAYSFCRESDEIKRRFLDRIYAVLLRLTSDSP